MDTTQQELRILSDKLTETERRLTMAEDVIKRQAGAIIDVDYKLYASMKQLLTANDVWKTAVGHEPMRVQILEILNDLRRFARGKFEAAGIHAYAEGAETLSGRTDRPATPIANKVQLAGSGDATGVFAGNSPAGRSAT